MNYYCKFNMDYAITVVINFIIIEDFKREKTI